MEGFEQYKIILLGEPGVGKTSFFFRVRDDIFLGNSVATVSGGVEHLEYEMKIEDTRIKVLLANLTVFYVSPNSNLLYIMVKMTYTMCMTPFFKLLTH